jgi:hypothetical protein
MYWAILNPLATMMDCQLIDTLDFRLGRNHRTAKKKTPFPVLAITAKIGMALSIFIIWACSDSKSHLQEPYLVKVGSSVLTVNDFENSFEFVKIAYSHNDTRKTEILQKARIRLLSQKIEEMVLLERARELNIQISDKQLEDAIASIKKDYPEGAFEQTLLENAISLKDWKGRLKDRLLINRVITDDLIADQEITPDDLSDYVAGKAKRDGPELYVAPQAGESQQANEHEVTLDRLRKIKAEKAYQDWIKTLRSKYAVEVNMDQWKMLQESL